MLNAVGFGIRVPAELSATLGLIGNSTTINKKAGLDAAAEDRLLDCSSSTAASLPDITLATLCSAVPVYSIVVNMIITPFDFCNWGISGTNKSAFNCFDLASSGSALSWLLYYLSHLLIELVLFSHHQEIHCCWYNFCFAVTMTV